MHRQRQFGWLLVVASLLLSGLGPVPKLGAEARGPTGSAEKHVWYTLYRGAIAAYGPEQRVWAYPGLPTRKGMSMPAKGSAKDGTLNAVEMLAGMTGNDPKLAKIPAGMDLENPSLLHFVKLEWDSGYTNDVYTTGLIGKTEKGPPRWSDTIEKASMIALAVHAELLKKAAVQELSTFEQNLLRDMGYILQFRRSNQALYLGKAMNKKFAGLQVAYTKTPWSTPDFPKELQEGKFLFGVDWPQTLAQAKTSQANPSEDELRQYEKGYGTGQLANAKSPEEEKAIRHGNVVRSWDHFRGGYTNACTSKKG